MTTQPANPPYFDGRFQRLAVGDERTVTAFGRHVRWGSRYQELAEANRLVLSEAIDITAHTLPTDEFLYSSTADWPDAREAELFTRATRLLEKACRNGMLQYQILRFAHT